MTLLHDAMSKVCLSTPQGLKHVPTSMASFGAKAYGTLQYTYGAIFLEPCVGSITKMIFSMDPNL